MDEQRLPENVETELRALLMEADMSNNDGVLAKTDVKSESPMSMRISKAARKLLEVAVIVALLPLLVFFVAALWLLIFLIANLVRFVIAKVKGKSFEVFWPLPGAAGAAGTIGSLKIVIFTNDHPPPHFHVITDMYNVKFDIETCDLLSGELPGKHLKAVRKWHASRIDLLRKKWIATRPGDANG